MISLIIHHQKEIYLPSHQKGMCYCVVLGLHVAQKLCLYRRYCSCSSSPAWEPQVQLSSSSLGLCGFLPPLLLVHHKLTRTPEDTLPIGDCRPCVSLTCSGLYIGMPIHTYIGEGNGNPFQHPCLEDPMDRGTWRATVHGLGRVRHDLATEQQYMGMPWCFRCVQVFATL